MAKIISRSSTNNGTHYHINNEDYPRYDSIAFDIRNAARYTQQYTLNDGKLKVIVIDPPQTIDSVQTPLGKIVHIIDNEAHLSTGLDKGASVTYFSSVQGTSILYNDCEGSTVGELCQRPTGPNEKTTSIDFFVPGKDRWQTHSLTQFNETTASVETFIELAQKLNTQETVQLLDDFSLEDFKQIIANAFPDAEQAPHMQPQPDHVIGLAKTLNEKAQKDAQLQVAKSTIESQANQLAESQRQIEALQKQLAAEKQARAQDNANAEKYNEERESAFNSIITTIKTAASKIPIWGKKLVAQIDEQLHQALPPARKNINSHDRFVNELSEAAQQGQDVATPSLGVKNHTLIVQNQDTGDRE